MEDSKKYTNAQLREQIRRFFEPAEDWKDCAMPLLKEELSEQVNDLLEGYFEDYRQLEAILLSLSFKYSFNEHNKKYYWLVNPVNNTVVY